MTFVKILIILLILFLLFFPLLPLPMKLRRFSTFRALRYDPPHNRLNLSFVLLTALEFVGLAVVYVTIFRLAKSVMGISFIAKLLNKAPAVLEFNATIFSVLILNIITLYALVLLKTVVKNVLNRACGFKKEEKKGKKKKKKGEDTTEPEAVTAKKERKRGRIASVLRSKRKKKQEETEGEPKPEENETPRERVTTAKNEKFQKEHPILFRLYQKFWGLFFEKPDFVYARRYVFTAVTAIQFFIYLVEILYAVLFFSMLLAVFFSVPDFLYKMLSFVTAKIYIYPFISILLLQELCNTFRSACKEPEETKKVIKREEEEKEEKKKIGLNKLRSKILRRYAKNHSIRYFPAVDTKVVSEYTATNDLYKDALTYISTYMKAHYGRVIQSYMGGLDTVFNGRHVYFGSSFYSQLGEYIITYTYVRLLAGERMLFIVSDRSQVVKLQQYIGNRLTDITGVTRDETWRVYSADSHHVNEADVLVGVPEDFATDNLVENYPAFFEEAANAVFVDADRILNLNSYLCTIMASRLFEATEGRIRFMFLSRDVLQGFSASLRKFFCIDEEVIDCNSAEENENVSYMLWNRERGALYNKHGQSETTIECLVAEAAYDAAVDGIRILTSVPLKPAEKQNFMAHDVEINEFHKKVPTVNYMICTDDRCNLAAAIYAYTRFHGREASILHILSRPYLLREYFGDRVEMYSNRSDLIKPRATEHADTKKLLLLRLLCEATASKNGIPLSRFRVRIDAAIKEKKLASAFDDTARVAFLLSELMNDPAMIEQKSLEKSDGQKHTYTMAKKQVYSYYSLLQPERKDGYELKSENHISFLRMEEIFEKLLKNNTRVELYLNGNLLGRLDNFPERVYQQYLPGQSIIFDNCEYEIESIAKGGTAIYLRQENITYNSCVDTALLRRYSVKDMKSVEDGVAGIYHFTAGSLDKICVEHKRAHIYGETYGFYNLMANSQTLDFVEGVVGNAALDERIVKSQARDMKDGLLLSVRLCARGIKCTDGMRKLLSAVLSEFIRTMFPDAYRCIAVCPVLSEPTDATGIDGNFGKQVETLYPYLVGEQGTLPTAEEDSVELLIINDAKEDIGVLDMLYDGAGRIMEEVFSYIVDYLSWLKKKEKLPKGQSHYIYFGSDHLPDVYDLDGCLELLGNCVRRFDEEEGKEVVEEEQFCSFCRTKLETGRYSAFDKSRLICFDCEVSMISEEEELSDLIDKVYAYWKSQFPEIEVPKDVTVDFDDAYDLDEEAAKNNHYYRLDEGARKILVESDSPENTAFVSILRGLIYYWQKDNNLIIAESEAQMTYEERRFLRSKSAAEAASYAVKLLDTASRELLKKIKSYVEEAEGNTSFGYMLRVLEEIEAEEEVEVPTIVPEDDEGSDALFDPDLVPRFWKRYLRGKHATDDDGEKESLLMDSAAPGFVFNRILNAPPPVDDDDDLDSDIAAADEDDALEAESAEKPKVGEDTAEDTTPAPTPAPSADEETEEDGEKPTKEKKRRVSLGHIKTGDELVPFEEEEKTNKSLHLYNEIARRIADYSREPVSIAGFTDEEVSRIYYFVLYDYPEFFWTKGYSWRGSEMTISYRCTLPGSEDVDVKKVTKYRKELRKSVKYFTKGITSRTKPFDAMMTIYRRLVLNLDYDGVGLDGGVGRDTREDDVLRSLYSALVKRKVVCAGYAVAMQYLLQSVGICCGSIVSDTHQWNVVKFGRHCYHLDVTWADNSNTKSGAKDKDKIFYSYCCITTELNNRGGKQRLLEMPLFKDVEDFTSIKHDYFRMNDAYLASYDEEKIAKIFAKAASEPEFEGSARCAAFRMRDLATFKLVLAKIQGGGYWSIVEKAKALLGKNKKAVKLLEKAWGYYSDEKTYTIHFFAN